jgi:hypothetical protein
MVHYVSYGTPGGEYPSVCRAAVITAVHGLPDAEKISVGESVSFAEHVDLCVLNPEGLFFNHSVPQNEPGKGGGTWHWPERVD